MNVPWFGSDREHQMNILLFYYDFNLDVELLLCALLTNSIHSNRLRGISPNLNLTQMRILWKNEFIQICKKKRVISILKIIVEYEHTLVFTVYCLVFKIKKHLHTLVK